MVNSALVSTSANRVSRETPRQAVPSFDQLVTQWMSVVTSSAGSARNCSQFQRVKFAGLGRDAEGPVIGVDAGSGPRREHREALGEVLPRW